MAPTLIRGRQVSASQMNAQIHAAVSAFWGVRLDTAIPPTEKEPPPVTAIAMPSAANRTAAAKKTYRSAARGVARAAPRDTDT